MVSFPPTGELRLMAVCLPEDSGVVFFLVLDHEERWGGPPSVYHLISEHEQIRLYLCGCTSAWADAIIAHFFWMRALCLFSRVSLSLCPVTAVDDAPPVAAASVKPTRPSHINAPLHSPNPSFIYHNCACCCVLCSSAGHVTNSCKTSHGSLTFSQRRTRT